MEERHMFPTWRGFFSFVGAIVTIGAFLFYIAPKLFDSPIGIVEKIQQQTKAKLSKEAEKISNSMNGHEDRYDRVTNKKQGR